MSSWSAHRVPDVALAGSEGELVTVRVSVEPRLLEELLDALAEVSFPINPQIRHQGASVHVRADGRREARAAAVVEFPAYAGRLDEVRSVLERGGFDPRAAEVRSMLDEIGHGGALAG